MMNKYGGVLSSIEKRKKEAAEIEYVREEVRELDIAYDRCGCAECLERLQRMEGRLEQLILYWYHAKESDFE